MSTIGLDLGTSGVRAVGYDDRGRELAAATTSTALHRTDGRVEIDAEQLVRVAGDAIRRVAGRCAEAGDPVAAIAYACQGEAVVPVDRRWRCLAAVPVGMDQRGRSAADELARRLGADRVQALTGQPLHPMFSAYKIAAGDPDWQPPRAAGYRTLGDYVLGRWGAAPATDWTLAARTGLFEVDTRRWSAEMITALSSGAPWLAELGFPDPVAPGTPLGSVTAAAATELGVPAGTALVAGLHDQAASFLGAGGRAGTTAIFSLGSSDCLTVETPDRPAGLLGTGFATYPWRPGRWLTLAGTAAGGWALDWLADLVGAPSTAALVAEAASAPAEVVVLPYLAGSGTLDNDPAACGAVLGLTLGTSRAELVRAFLESAGYELAAILAALAAAGIDVGDVRAVGTGAADRVSAGVRATAAGRQLTPVAGHASARGAALLAAAALGRVDLDAAPAPELDAPLTPADDPGYIRQRQRYRDLYRALRPL